MNEINEDRDEHIKKLFNEPKAQDWKEVSESKTDLGKRNIS